NTSGSYHYSLVLRRVDAGSKIDRHETFRLLHLPVDLQDQASLGVDLAGVVFVDKTPQLVKVEAVSMRCADDDVNHVNQAVRQVSPRLPSALPGVVLDGFLQVRPCLLVVTDLFGEHGVSVPLFDVRNNRGFGAHWLVHGKHELSHVVALCHPMSPSCSSSSSYRS